MQEKIVLRLAKFIEMNNLSVRAFEERAGITQGVVSKVIKNNTSFSIENLAKIGETFPSLNMHWLINGKGKMFAEGEDSPVVALPDAQPFTEAYIKELIQKGIQEALKLQQA
jgi:transcriptional regulator with XRE-family HTH domain